MKPFKVVAEDDTHITYEYCTAYTWALYAGVLVFLAGSTIPNDWVMLLGALIVAAQLLLKLLLARDVNRQIRQAMQSQVVEVSGNKASFGNPLTVRLPK